MPGEAARRVGPDPSPHNAVPGWAWSFTAFPRVLTTCSFLFSRDRPRISSRGASWGAEGGRSAEGTAGPGRAPAWQPEDPRRWVAPLLCSQVRQLGGGREPFLPRLPCQFPSSRDFNFAAHVFCQQRPGMTR